MIGAGFLFVHARVKRASKQRALALPSALRERGGSVRMGDDGDGAMPLESGEASRQAILHRSAKACIDFFEFLFQRGTSQHYQILCSTAGRCIGVLFKAPSHGELRTTVTQYKVEKMCSEQTAWCRAGNYQH